MNNDLDREAIRNVIARQAQQIKGAVSDQPDAIKNALALAAAFIASEYQSMEYAPQGEWLAPEARPVFKALVDALTTLEAPIPQRYSGTYHIEHDGFTGTPVGSYVTHEGKRGAVLQQIGTRVVHVYGEKWLKKVFGEPKL